MKKLIVIFILLLGLGGAGFYFGWVPLDIPPQSRGVIFTKTGGWDTQAAMPGNFSWRWEKLIPTNFTLYLYPDTVRTAAITSRGSLPSADVYALFLDGNPSFRYSLRFSLSYRVKEDYFPVLAKEQGVLPENLDEWLASIHTSISAKCPAAVAAWFEKTRAETASPGAAEKEITRAIEEALAADYPFLEVTSLAPEEITLPDMGLYAKARELYIERADSRKESLRENAGDLMTKSLRDDARMESLKKYGELLTQYPVLLDFLKSEKDFVEGAGW